MSLTARIALSPSRGVVAAEIAVPLLGIPIAATAIAARFPDSALWMAIAALLAAAVLLTAMIVAGSRAPLVLMVSDRPEVELVGSALADGAWRLAESTVAWPAFAMLALERDDRRRPLWLPVAMSGLAPADRRAFARFLTWSMRARFASQRSAG